MRLNKWTLGLASLGLVSLAPSLLAQTAPAPAPATPQPFPVVTALSATTISGYVDTSAVWNPGTGNANPAPYAFNAGKQDGFNVDSIDLKVAKVQDEGKWSAGYTAELMFGQDGESITGTGGPIGGGSGASLPEYIRQAYVTLATPIGNGLDFQLGRFDNILGYESNDSYKNPNWTRSYGYSIEPTEHTGLLATYKFSDAISVQVGVANTVTTLPLNFRVNPGESTAESKKSIISLLSLTAPDSWGFLKGSGFYAGFDHGQGVGSTAPAFGAPGVASHDQTEWYVGLTLNTPIKDLTLGASWDADEHLDLGGADAGYVESFAGYSSYKLTEKLTLNGRIEYANGNALGAIADADNGTAGNPLNKVFALTGTLQYDLWANVITRLEVRWDHEANGGGDAFGGGGNIGSGAAPDKKNEVLIAANVIYKF